MCSLVCALDADVLSVRVVDVWAGVWLFLFGGGFLILGRPRFGAVLLAGAVAGGALIFRALQRESWSDGR